MSLNYVIITEHLIPEIKVNKQANSPLSKLLFLLVLIAVLNMPLLFVSR